MRSSYLLTEMRVEQEDPYRLIDAYYGCFGSQDTRADVARSIVENTGLRDPSAHMLLDMGCGTGCITVALAKLFKHVRAVDVEARAVQLTQQRARQHGMENLEVWQTNWISLPEPFSASAFDVAVCWGNSLNYTDSWLKQDVDVAQSQHLIEATLHGVATALKPGGIFLFQVDGDFTKGQGQTVHRAMTVSEGAKQHVLDWEIEQTEGGIRKNRTRRSLYSAKDELERVYKMTFVGQALFVEDLTDMLHAAGFNDVEVKGKTSNALGTYHVLVASK